MTDFVYDYTNTLPTECGDYYMWVVESQKDYVPVPETPPTLLRIFMVEVKTEADQERLSETYAEKYEIGEHLKLVCTFSALMPSLSKPLLYDSYVSRIKQLLEANPKVPGAKYTTREAFDRTLYGRIPDLKLPVYH